MRALFLKLYGASLIAIILAIIATFYLLWYQWQPENNYQLMRFSGAVITDLVKELELKTHHDQGPRLKVLDMTLPYTAAELKVIGQFSDQLHSSISLLFIEGLEFSESESARLQRKQIVYRNDSDAKRAYLLYDQERTLEVELTRLRGSANQWMASLIYLAYYTDQDLETKLKRISGLLSESERPKIEPLRDAQLRNHELARLYQSPQARSALTSSTYKIQFIHLSNESLNEPLLITYHVELSPALLFPPVIFVPFLSFLLGIALWFGLSPYARKACKLSETTQRFSKGDLQARARLNGSSPIDHIAQQFDQAADHVENLIKVHKGLLRGVAHELRTPIARLYFYGELLSTENDPSRSKELLADFNSNVQELSDLTDELLNSHRYEAGLVFSQDPIDLSLTLREICREAIDLPLIELSVYETEELYILGEVKPIKRLINNLINNASRFGREQVKVGLSISTENEKTLIISVEDDGDGIPLGQREAIFNAFCRIDESRNRETGGVGLGLMICKKIAIAHGGKISVSDSEELGGAKFIVELPRHTLSS